MHIDIFKIPLYYISFTKKPILEKHLEKTGFKDINHFKAVDGRKFDPKELLEKNIISIRTYNDLIYGREQSTGMPTLGGVGCTLSHRTLWKFCIDQKLPYIIIAEDDVNFKKPISKKEIENINHILKQPNGMFISTNNFKKDSEYFYGTHFYVATNGCIHELYKHSLPIDVQTDSYINNINNRNLIKIEGFALANQSIHKSSIQDWTKCIKCILPKSIMFYIVIIFIVIAIIVLYIYTRKRLSIVQSELASCYSSCRSGK